MNKNIKEGLLYVLYTSIVIALFAVLYGPIIYCIVHQTQTLYFGISIVWAILSSAFVVGYIYEE